MPSFLVEKAPQAIWRLVHVAGTQSSRLAESQRTQGAHGAHRGLAVPLG
jgi:hypothetical protein